MRVLIIEDERDIAEAIQRGLVREGFTTVIADNGNDGYWHATEGNYALIVLDILLPGINGYQLCRRVREAGVETPILMLTAKSGEFDEVEALETGADDFLRKPFSIHVLLARCKALLRRRPLRLAPTSFAGIELDLKTRRCIVDGQDLQLTPRESQLLASLLMAKDVPVTKQGLLHSVWGLDFEGDANVVDVYIRYLRKKLGSDRIKTIPRIGYVLQELNTPALSSQDSPVFAHDEPADATI